MEGRQPRVGGAGAGARLPLGVVVILSLLEIRRGRSLARFAAWFPLLAAFAVEGFRGGAKVLVEFCSDLLVAQELPADGGEVLLVPVVRDAGGFSRGLRLRSLRPSFFSDILLLR